MLLQVLLLVHVCVILHVYRLLCAFLYISISICTNFGACFLVCVLVHSFVLKLVFCCWNVGVTCVHVVFCVLFLALWFMCVCSCRASWDMQEWVLIHDFGCVSVYLCMYVVACMLV